MKKLILIPLLAGLLMNCTPKHVDNPSYKVSGHFKSKVVDGEVTQLIHKKSGAKLVLIKNKDQAQTFMAAFKTPPYDDTGLFHIFEHAVLAGSRLYPSKSNFFNVVRSSVASFINAMTSSVSTLYPFITRDPKDFDNLLSIYMDSVFFPKVTTDPRIIKREGWRYEVHPETKKMSINGIVFNEMKGAFSGPHRLLWLNLYRTLLPQTPYAYSSGGLPKKIATLKFEQIVEAHKKYYHPQNSLIFLYGDIDFPKALTTIDRDFLSHFNKDKKFKPPEITLQKDFDTSKPSIVKAGYPGHKQPKKDFVAKGYVLGKLTPVEKDAIYVLLDAFVSNDIAPLKLRTLKEGVATSVSYRYLKGDDNAVALVFEGTEGAKLNTLEDILQDEIEKVIQQGLNPEFLTSILNKFEFSYKETNSNSNHKGLFLGRVITDHWFYPDESLSQKLDFISQFKKLRNLLNKKHFAKAAFQKHFKQNTHFRWLVMEPDPKISEKFNATIEEKVAAALKLKPLEEYEKEDQLYRKWVSAEEPQEIISKTPLLKLSDLKTDEQPIPFHKSKTDTYEMIEYPQSTNGISYINLFFDLKGVEESNLKNLKLFTYLLKKTNTENYSFQKLSREINTYIGHLDFDINIYQSFKKTEQFKPFLVVKLRFLDENRTKSINLLKELLAYSRFSPKDRAHDLISELKTKMNNSISYRAMSLANKAARKNFFPSQGAFNDEIKGGTFEEYILKSKIDPDEITVKFKNILTNIFNQNRLHLVTVTAEKAQLNILKENLAGLKNSLPSHGSKDQKWTFSKQKNYEAYIIPGEVQYVTEAASFKAQGLEYSGALEVYSKYLTSYFLHPRIREQSGAYGAWNYMSRNGLWTMQTFRDPNLKKSFDIFSRSVDFMSKEKIDYEKLTPTILGSLKVFYRDRSVSEKTYRMTYLHLSDLSWDDYMKTKKEILETKPEDFDKITRILRVALKNSKKAVAGNSEKIKKEGSFFKSTFSFL